MKPSATYTRSRLSLFLFSAAIFAATATTPAFAGLLEGLQAYDHKNWSTAYSELMPLAEKGNAKAMGRIGSLYRDGKGGVEQNYQEAMRWYRLSAEKGDAKAQNNLGAMYQNELGVPYNEKEAIAWYRKSAKQGNDLAKENLANMLAPKRSASSDSYYSDLAKERAQEPTEAERYEQIRSDGCAMSHYDCKTDWSGGKY